MSELISQNNGCSGELLLEGIRDAAAEYKQAISEVDPACLTSESGPTELESRQLRKATRGVIVPDVLTLTDDVNEIRKSKEYKKARKQGYIEEQYIFDVSVGGAVARNLHQVSSTPEALAILPDRTVAILEVNANRGFPEGREDNAGCHGIPVDWLGYLAIDIDYIGEEAMKGSHKELDRRIDYMGEPGSWTTFGEGLARNAARIRVRPAYPLVPDGSYDKYGPREVYEARLADNPKDAFYREHAVLRGEYRICRAVSLLHNLSNWNSDELVSREDVIKAEVDRHLARILAND